jgi:hypothetical protein
MWFFFEGGGDSGYFPERRQLLGWNRLLRRCAPPCLHDYAGCQAGQTRASGGLYWRGFEESAALVCVRLLRRCAPRRPMR